MVDKKSLPPISTTLWKSQLNNSLERVGFGEGRFARGQLIFNRGLEIFIKRGLNKKRVNKK